MAEKRNRFKGEVLIGEPTVEEDVPVIVKTDLAPYVANVEKAQQLQEAGKALGIIVNADAAKLVDHRLRVAARGMGIGLRVEHVEYGTTRGAKHSLSPGQTKLLIQTAPKRERKTNTANGNGAAKTAGKKLPQVPAGMRK